MAEADTGRTPPLPRTERGEHTRARLLEAAEHVFAERGYHQASIVKITERAGVAQGTFYLHFVSKLQVFEELVDDLNSRVRRAMTDAAVRASSRIEAEQLGLEAVLALTAEHPALYRIIRQAEVVSPPALQRHYSAVAGAYSAGLAAAMGRGEILPGDPEVIAYLLTAIGEMIGMRWILWPRAASVPEPVLAEAMAFVTRGLGAPPVTGAGGASGATH
ncbi:MAG TPA: TetR/AcrR family transcriptional regulator [Acidimicrobiales bacterium]|nr:TetR/AcrR family transcriptional regulator [Acidimicrobiales bacterium]